MHLLINQQSLIVNTEASVHVNWDKVRISAGQAQNEYIKPALCKALYDELVSQDETNTLTPENLLLKDAYVMPALSYWTLYIALPFIQTELRAKGLFQHFDETGSVVNGGIYGTMKQAYRDRAEYNIRLLHEFLNEYPNIYPLFRDCAHCSSNSIGSSLPGGIFPRRIRNNNILDW